MGYGPGEKVTVAKLDGSGTEECVIVRGWTRRVWVGRRTQPVGELLVVQPDGNRRVVRSAAAQPVGESPSA